MRSRDLREIRLEGIIRRALERAGGELRAMVLRDSLAEEWPHERTVNCLRRLRRHGVVISRGHRRSAVWQLVVQRFEARARIHPFFSGVLSDAPRVATKEEQSPSLTNWLARARAAWSRP